MDNKHGKGKLFLSNGEVFEGKAQVTIDGKHFLGPKGHDHFKI